MNDYRQQFIGLTFRDACMNFICETQSAMEAEILDNPWQELLDVLRVEQDAGYRVNFGFMHGKVSSQADGRVSVISVSMILRSK